MNFNLVQNIKYTTRQTYDILSWLGDCGGLKDGFFGLGQIIMSAFSAYRLKTLLLSTLFRIT